ncbi:CaiB/BaiF CoA transferase family protein [Evansella halocellulosilytica]|uniref:CaiB/BaiF CoA transferase family protein n=1 Tax=Evansella halocellulosilytica TaxID=2011013 RepID=UPI000BB8F98D|nr:CaiB/BaiF CoA-transferase family protein [Evansella halocellulosilytica]
MLKGIQVIDFSFYLPGPFATLRLADMGAEVIKVEPQEGDPARNLGVKKDGTGLVFLANNRNKKSITLNLKNQAAQEIARKLIKTADVVVESFRPGVAKKLGIDYERVKKLNNAIVYCSVSGYGQNRTMSSLGSHDLNYMALSGALAQLKDRDGIPVHPKNTFADLVSSIAVNEAILSGLIQRGKTGEGTYIDFSMANAMMSFMSNHVLFHQETGSQHGVPFLGGEIVSYQIYETKDERFVSLAALEKKFWVNFCHAVKREDWIEAHDSPAKEENNVYSDLKVLFSERTLEEWTQFSIKVDCCLTPILETSELASFPYFQKGQKVVDSKWGMVQVFTHQGSPLEEASPPPVLGEHTEEILMKRLQVSSQQIKEWKNGNVF